MLETAGIIHLYELGCPTLPPNAPEDLQTLWRKVILHVRCIRSATRNASEPFPLSWRFIKDWMGPACEWGQYHIQKLKSWLIARGVLHFDHEEKGISYWRIGSKALRRGRGDAPILKTESENVADVEATPVPVPVAHTGHAWSAVAPARARVCPLAADDPDHDEATCRLWQVYLRIEERRVSGSPPLVELPRFGGEATHAT
jgi:hypothetical protein